MGEQVQGPAPSRLLLYLVVPKREGYSPVGFARTTRFGIHNPEFSILGRSTPRGLGFRRLIPGSGAPTRFNTPLRSAGISSHHYILSGRFVQIEVQKHR